MVDEGMHLKKHIRELAFMGFVEVIKNLATIIRNFRQVKTDIQVFKPDVIVLVDYPGFNLRMARWAKHKCYKVAYYISPTVWAWKEGRVETIRRYVDRLMCILPFEKAFYAKHGIAVDYVGNPSAEKIGTLQREPHSMDQPVIALLPGSRVQEIKAMLPLMLKVASQWKNYRICIAQAPSLPDDLFLPLLQGYEVECLKNKTYELLQVAKAALVTSGTATLETALFGVPQVVCYRANPVSYAIARKVVKVKYISLVNLILDRELIREFIQADFNEENLMNEMSRLLEDMRYRSDMQNGYNELRQMLMQGRASEETAKRIIELAFQ